MSSDSEDDCYGNIAQKLNSIKSKYKEDKLQTANLLEDSLNIDNTPKTVNLTVENLTKSAQIDCEISLNDSDVEEISLDAIIAKNSKKRVTRSSKRNSDISTDNILPARFSRKKSKYASANSSTLSNSDNNLHSSVTDLTNLTNESLNESTATTAAPRGRGRGRGRGRARGRKNTSTISNVPEVSNESISNPPETTLNTANDTNSAINDSTNSSLDTTSTTNRLNTSRGRGRGRRARGRSRSRRMWTDELFPVFNFSRRYTNLPTYSVGNTDFYPDECHEQPLFSSSNTPKTNEVIVVGENELENDSIDENEELSVKVYWQNCEYVKFTIRRFQKLTQIFNFFAERENVSHDKLFFTYNDKILKIDDTPDSITYSIVKFIDGGIINQSVSKIVQHDGRNLAKDGIKLKFQCQNVKKPFEISIRADDKMSMAMMMCAEHLEKPLDKLKFYFDGDLILGKNTPNELELEGGECIDVKIS